MSDERRKIFLVGSSHLKRMAREFVQLPFDKNFEIVNLARPGATYDRIIWPKIEEVKSTDFLLVQFLGNDIFQKKFVKFERKVGKKCFHLTKFAPEPLPVILEKINQAKNRLATYSGKVILINIIVRHFRCCSLHQDTRVLQYQLRIKKLIKKELSSENVIILDPLRLIYPPQYCGTEGTSFTLRKLKEAEYHAGKFLLDSVHLFAKHYRQICLTLIEKYFK
jgi:hypothetical protein